MSVVIAYNQLHTQLTQEENEQRLDIVAEITRKAQLRCLGEEAFNKLFEQINEKY